LIITILHHHRALDDLEIKRCFQDFINKLDKVWKEKEKIRKDEIVNKISILALNFKVLLDKLAFEGVLGKYMRIYIYIYIYLYV
jgi:hypothetical protein